MSEALGSGTVSDSVDDNLPSAASCDVWNYGSHAGSGGPRTGVRVCEFSLRFRRMDGCISSGNVGVNSRGDDSGNMNGEET